MPMATISDYFSIGRKKFGLIRDYDSRGVIVLTNYANLPSKRLIVKDGSGGYAWQYLPKRKLVNCKQDFDILASRLGLHDKSEQQKFIRRWNKII